MSEQSPPNMGTDLRRIHRAITRGLTVAQENGQAFAQSGFPDAVTAEGFWKYCQGLEAVVDGHHRTEDDLYFPFLRDRLPEVDFDGLAAEHHTMEGLLAEMKAAQEAGSVADLAAAVAKMNAIWQPHIGKEERWFSPEVAAQIITVQEYIDLAQKGAAHSQQYMQPPPVAIPFFLYNLEADDRAFFLAAMPPEVTQNLVPVVWKDVWAPMKPFLLD